MGEPARHLAPRRDLLRPNQRGHIVDDQHGAVETAVRAGHTRRRRDDMALPALAHERHFLRERIHLGARRLVEHVVHGREIGAGEDVDRGVPDHVARQLQQTKRRRD